MKKSFLTSLFLISSLFPVVAENLTLSDGTVLNDIEVIGSGVNTLKIRHHEGITTVYGNQLPKDWQEKYKMTSDDVQLRMEAEQQKKDAQKKLKQEAITESGKTARYLTATDVRKLYTLVGELSSLEATATALRWNHLEAKRVGDDQLAATYLNDWNALQPQLAVLAQKKADLEVLERKQELQEREQLVATLKDTQQQIQKQNNRTAQLENSLREVKERPPITTIITPPSYTYNNNNTIVRPCPPSHNNNTVIRPYPPSNNNVLRPQPRNNIEPRGSSNIMMKSSTGVLHSTGSSVPPTQIIKTNDGRRVFK